LLEPTKLRSIPQIDLVSSLSLSLGLPIPFNNLGAVIPEMFASDVNVQGEWGLLRALRLNAAQVMRYLETYIASSRSHGFSDDALSEWRRMYRRAEASYQELAALTSSNARARGGPRIELLEERVSAEYYAFMRVVLGSLRQMWAQFDAVLIIAGLSVLLLLAVALAAIYACSHQLTLEAIVALMWKKCVAGGVVGVIGARALSVVLVSASVSHISLLEASVAGLAIGTMCTLCVLLLQGAHSNSEPRPVAGWSIPKALRGGPISLLNAVACTATIIHGAAFASNSYTFSEDSIVLYLSQTLMVALAAAALFSLQRPRFGQKSEAGLRALLGATTVLVLNRISFYSTVCREEQLPGCTPTFYGSPSASISSVSLAVANIFLVWLVPFVMLRFLRRSHSDRAMVARLWVGVGMRLSMGMSAAYWFFDSIDGRSSSSASFATAASPGAQAATASSGAGGTAADWSELRIVLARMAIGVALGGGFAAWYSSPFCLDVDISKPTSKAVAGGARLSTNAPTTLGPANSQQTAVVLGYGNAYGAAYLIFTTVVFCVLYLVQQPMGGIMLSLLFIKLLICAETFDALRDALAANYSTSLLPAQMVTVAMLAYLDYFTTGHQFTLVSVQWSTAFVGVKEMQIVICGAIVALNTLGSFVLAAVCVPLAVLWNESLGSQLLRMAPENYVTRLAGAAMLFTSYHAVVATSSAIFAAWFRRHLMVWKIFAPRFMFAVPVFMASVVVVLALAVGFAAVRVLRLGLNVGNIRGMRTTNPNHIP
ncbi:mannose-ethanolamine phosphotransferase gpi13, partial [Coemansia thaxteri]